VKAVAAIFSLTLADSVQYGATSPKIKQKEFVGPKGEIKKKKNRKSEADLKEERKAADERFRKIQAVVLPQLRGSTSLEAVLDRLFHIARADDANVKTASLFMREPHVDGLSSMSNIIYSFQRYFLLHPLLL
jgi:hypothetical protein